jgi:sulfite dehydrogenase (quinone) subunit SoeB
VHDENSEASKAIQDRGGYALMPEWGTNPANHYLPRRRTDMVVQPDQLQRSDNPIKKDGQLPKPAQGDPSIDDVATW